MKKYIFLNTIFSKVQPVILTQSISNGNCSLNSQISILERVVSLGLPGWDCTNKVWRWAECNIIFWEERSYCIWTMTSDSQSYTVSWSADVFVCKPAHVANQNQRPNREVTFQTRTYWLFYCGQGSRYIDKACFLNIWWHNMALLGSWTIRLLHIVPFLNVMLCTDHMHPNTYLDNSNYLISIVSKDAITHI